MLPLSMVALLALAGPPARPAPPALQGGVLAIKVERIVKPDGTLGAGGWIVVKNGRLEAVGAAEAPAGAATLDFAHGVAAPGFIDPVTALGAGGDLGEPARAYTPEAQAADALDADHSDFRKAAAGGITTVGLAPDDRNIVGGRVAIVRTSGEQGLAVLGGPGPLRCSLSNAAFDPDRVPTSRMLALPQLREMLKGDALKAPGPCLVEATTPDEIRVTLETFQAAGRAVALLGPTGAADADDLLKGSNALAVVGPFSLSQPLRALALPKTLAAQGVAVAFTAGGRAESLRLTAALAVRAGFPADKAMQALTTVPAKVLGLDDCGSLEAGRRADVVIFGGDPLDLSTPIQLVLVGGAPQEKKKGTP